MNGVIGTENRARNWFYSPLVILGGERPYDYCKNGNLSEIDEMLGRIEAGMYS